MEESLEKLHRIKRYLDAIGQIKTLHSQPDYNKETIDDIENVWKSLDGISNAESTPQEILYEMEILKLSTVLMKEVTHHIRTNAELTIDDFVDHLNVNMLRANAACRWGGAAQERWAKLEYESGRLLPVVVCCAAATTAAATAAEGLRTAAADADDDDRANRNALHQKRAKQSSQPLSHRTEPTKLTTGEVGREEASNDGDMLNVNKLYRLIKRNYNDNSQRPLPYFQFVLDPTSFSKTVENIFKVSFLVRDNFVQMSMRNNGKLVLKPLGKSGKNCAAETDKKQTVVSLSYENWQFLVNKLNIKEAAIPDIL